MPGKVVTWRTAKNTTRSKVEFSIKGIVPAGSKIKIEPSKIKLNPGQSKSFKVTITSDAPFGEQQFGQIILKEKVKKHHRAQTLHLPVAFIHQQGAVELSQSCLPTTVHKNGTTTCDVVATNLGFDPQVVDLKSTTDSKFDIQSAVGATKIDNDTARRDNVTLAGATPGVPSVAPGGLFGYVPLDAFGITPVAVGDETIVNFPVPAYKFNGVTYASIGITSNGYAVAGGGVGTDVSYSPPAGPSGSPPNNVIAPLWTDLDGAGAPGVFAGVLTDSVDSWVVLEWRLNVWGTADLRTFQVWIGINGAQDITMAYAAAPTDPNGQDFLVGAENDIGQGDMEAVLPTGDLTVTSTNPTPGESVTYQLTLKAKQYGPGQLVTRMNADGVLGTTIVETDLTVIH